MKIKWLGHASFVLFSEKGTTLVTDPYDESLRYPFPSTPADICTVSHDHFDHNCTRRLKGKPRIVRKADAVEEKDVKIVGFNTFHDTSRGRDRGGNILFKITMDSLDVLHSGDLGHTLSPEDAQRIGRVDILLIPVGGTYTIDAQAATKVVETLKPRVTIPMHYKTTYLDFPITPVEDFLRGKKNVRKLSLYQVTRETLPKEDETIVLEI